jgi:2'-5' RNA ligase
MRIFIALDIPGEVRSGIQEYMSRAGSLAPGAHWARVGGLHVTLKFVGEASEARVQEMRTALASVKAKPFTVRFEGVRFFPNPRSARIFWTGVDGGDELRLLAFAIDAALAKLGIARENKPYHPHLTLARSNARPLRELQALLTDPPPQFGTMTAREFFLYVSQTQKGGSKYTRLQRFGLE